jgi:cysteine desulfurase
VADLINADPREIVFTSGATESNNLAIKGIAHFYGEQGKHIITSKTEHKAVLDTCRQLEREGFEVTYLEPMPTGLFTARADGRRCVMTPFWSASCTSTTRSV